jgi:hypothetical protein
VSLEAIYPVPDPNEGLSEDVSSMIENQRKRINRMEEENKKRLKELKKNKRKT